MDDTPVAALPPNAPPAAAPRRRLAVIAALGRNGVIGAGNGMPWHIPADLKRFRALTTGHTVIMGRKTAESIGRPLPGRENIVVTRNGALAAPGCRIAGSLEEALAAASLPEPVFCIGGGELYRQALPLADEAYLTEIDAAFEGDTFFPALAHGEWREVAREEALDPASGLRLAFVHRVRTGAARG